MNREYFLRFLILFLVLLLSCGRKPKPMGSLFPETLPRLHLIKIIKGEQAKKEVNKLHGTEIAVKNAWIAHYEGAFFEGNWHEAVIWVSEAYSEKEAQSQTKIMMERIMRNKKSPFHHFKIKHLKGIEVYIFAGMGQTHGVFQKDLLVFWISATPEVFDGVLNYYLSHSFADVFK